MTTVTEDDFQEAKLFWDLERLLEDLAQMNNGKSLTPTEQLMLRGLLCGYTPAKLARMRVKENSGQQANLSKGVRRHVKKLMKVKGYEVSQRMTAMEMLSLLKTAGYEKRLIASADEKTLQIQKLEGLIKVNSIGIGRENQLTFNNQVTVEFNIRVVTSLPVEEIMKMLPGSVGKGENEEK